MHLIYNLKVRLLKFKLFILFACMLLFVFISLLLLFYNSKCIFIHEIYFIKMEI